MVLCTQLATKDERAHTRREGGTSISALSSAVLSLLPDEIPIHKKIPIRKNLSRSERPRWRHGASDGA